MKKRTVTHLINHLEAELADKPSIELLAKSCYTSAMQLQRDFINVTGYSVNEYIRHLRLSHALCMIKASERPLAEIAYSCGYSSQQAMCREIKTILNTTATEYKQSNDFYFLSSLSDELPFQIEVSKVAIPKTICLAYYSPILHGIENNAVTLFLHHNPGYNKRIFGRNGTHRGSMLCYELYVEGSENLNISGFEQAGDFDGYQTICAQTRVKNKEDEINAAWDYLYAVWLSGSMFEYAGKENKSFESHYFEEYILKYAAPVRLQLYLPVVRQKECPKISIESIESMCFLVSSCVGYNAEKNASRVVIDYLSQHDPYILRNSKAFYVEQENDRFTCGVMVNPELAVNDNRVSVVNFENQTFAVMYLTGISDFCRSRQLLLNWLSENNFTPDGKAFAVYDTSLSYENPTMKVFCPIIDSVKFGTNMFGFDNTGVNFSGRIKG